MGELKRYPVSDAWDTIQGYLDICKENSENTEIKYKGIINEFLDIVFNTNLKYATWEELLSVDYEHVAEFMKKGTGRVSTINNKRSVLRAFFKHLKAVNKNINLECWYGKTLKDKGEKKSWGSLSKKEVSALIKFAERYKCKNKYAEGGRMGLYFELLYVTGLRSEALRTITDDNLRTQGEVGYIQVYDKTHLRKVAIQDKLFGRLRHIEGNIFPFSPELIRKVLRDFCKKYRIDKGRNITVHSLRKSSGQHVYDNRGLEEASKHLGHSHIATTSSAYIGKNKNLNEQSSYTDFEGEIDYNQFTKEELKEMLKRK